MLPVASRAQAVAAGSAVSSMCSFVPCQQEHRHTSSLLTICIMLLVACRPQAITPGSALHQCFLWRPVSRSTQRWSPCGDAAPWWRGRRWFCAGGVFIPCRTAASQIKVRGNAACANPGAGGGLGRGMQCECAGGNPGDVGEGGSVPVVLCSLLSCCQLKPGENVRQ